MPTPKRSPAAVVLYWSLWFLAIVWLVKAGEGWSGSRTPWSGSLTEEDSDGRA
jgi:hypothetical protein